MSSAQDPFYIVREEIQESVDELDKTIDVAARDTSWYGIDRVEIDKRRRWTSNAHAQKERSSAYSARDNDDFISPESDRQQLLLRQQDEELDELSANVIRIGDVGLTIHDELLAQDKIVNELGMEMDSTSNCLDFVQVTASASLVFKILSIC
ncbi:putative sugar transporter ERD6-like 6-like [Capsicum annuum]|nr:putative sugar transporter ERD6-like 6-like [Capsicum annuum]